MKIIFFYSEVMGYTEALIRTLSEKYNVQIILVYWDVHKLTPYQTNIKSIESFPRSNFTDDELCQLVNVEKPDIVYVSGWMDKGYLKAARQAKEDGIKVVAGLDTPWQGKLKQWVSATVLKTFWKKRFDYIWVPGIRQQEYAHKMGFKDRTLSHLYAADISLFNSTTDYLSKPKPYQLLFIGRLAVEKNIHLLCEAFAEINDKKDWVLIVVGDGPLRDYLPKLDSIKYIGFQPPNSLKNYMNQASAFCLPSQWEPWGLVVHEAAASGLPLLVSDACGAAEKFVEPEKNGWVFPSNNKEALKTALNKIFNSTVKERQKMGEHSHQLAQSITPDKSAQTLLSIIS